MRPPHRRTRRLPAANPAGNPLLNKSVNSERALGEPVQVLDATSRLADKAAAAGPAYVVLSGISFSHFLNDTMQSLIASVYPILKDNYALDFAQIGMITLAFQFTASLLQPVVGHFTDRKAQPFSLAIGMGLPSSDCCCLASRIPIRSFSSQRRSSALGRRCSIPNRRGSHGLLPEAATALRSRCSSLA